MFLMCVYKFKVLPHHQKFSSYAPGLILKIFQQSERYIAIKYAEITYPHIQSQRV